MTGSRPDKETARKMGMVPYDGAPPPNNGNYGGPVNNSNGGANFTGANSYSSNNSGTYPKVNNQTGGGGFGGNSSGNYPDVPPGGFYNGRSGNAAGAAGNGQQQLWSNGSGVKQGSAPTWPTNDQGVPLNGNNGQSQSRQGAPGAPGPTHAGPAGGAMGGGAGGYVQAPQNVSGPGAQQQPNWQGKGVSQGIPVNSGGGNPNWQGVPSNGHIDQGPHRRNVPKGDYVYYDGNGKQVQPNGAPVGPGPNEKHFHHHYYHNTHNTQPLPQQAGYPYDKKMEEKKKRSPAAAAIAAALITCWACTCCCHAPCGW